MGATIPVDRFKMQDKGTAVDFCCRRFRKTDSTDPYFDLYDLLSQTTIAFVLPEYCTTHI